jgi:Domain of unknown function (DUF1906)
VLAIAGLLISAVPAAAAAATAAHPGTRRVTYLGHSFAVPRSWKVINLAQRARTCVRFDRHVVYLGTAPPNEACPGLIIGTTEAMLVAPASHGAAHVSVENKMTRRITVVTRRLNITATFGAHPAVIDRILASAHLPRPAVAAAHAAVTDSPRVRPLPPKVTNYHGLAFDTCTAPSKPVMRTWWFDSPYGGIGIYLGGSDAACAQPNLTPSWLRTAAAEGWHFLPMYVGPQALFGELTKQSAKQGTAAAIDAVQHARQLGFGPATPIYYDMEAYSPSQSTRVLRFLSAWTAELHALGYASGVYSSSSSGVSDLARQYGLGKYLMPDVIYDALWDGRRGTHDPVFGVGRWLNHHRVHQYSGNITQTYGGIPINIDQDFMNVRLPGPLADPPSQAAAQASATSSPSQAVTQPGGTIDVFYRGTDGGLWYVRRAPGDGWARPVELGGRLASEPSAVALGGGHIRVFYQGTDGLLWQVRSGPVGWSRPRPLRGMGTLGGRPMAVAQPTGVIDVFWKDARGSGLSTGEYSPAGGWVAPRRLGGRLTSYPAPVISSRGVIQVFWKGRGGSLWHVARGQGGRWGRPENLGVARLGSQPQATARPGGRVEVFWRRPDKTAIVTGFLTANGHWRGPYQLGGGMPLSLPTPVSAGGLVHVFFSGHDGRLWQLTPTRSGRPGGPPQLVGKQPRSVPFAAVVSGQSRIDVFWQGPGGRLWLVRISPGNHASSPRRLDGPMP